MAAGVSVVIPTWNTRELLRECLRSLQDQPPDLALQTIVVDNGSSDGSAEMVRAEFADVRLVRLEDNHGYSGGINAGLREAAGELIVLLNSDTVVHGGALARIRDELRGREDVGAACPRCLDAGGRLQSFGARLMTARDYLRRIVGLAVHESPRDPERSGYVETPSGACLVLTRRGLEALGALDERLPLFLEEQDIARRLAQAGLRSFYVAAALVTHLGGRSVAQLDPNEVWLATHRSYAHMYRRHFAGLTSALLRLASALSMLPRVANSLLDIAAGRGGPRTAFGRARLRAKLAAIRAYVRA